MNADTILEHCESWMERIGWTGNFDRAASGRTGDGHAGIEFVDSEIYKLLEAMAWQLGCEHSAALERRYRALAERVAAAQQPDGYLHTSFGRLQQPPRYSNLESGHELYCFGHLFQAAVARLRTGHDDLLPQVARRLADHVYEQFGPGGRVGVCGHPEIEMALVELARATGEQRYLELAGLFIERRGTGTLGIHPLGQEYFQDDIPVRQATTMRGHAVRALYLASGALDVATETGDEDLSAAVRGQWANGVARRAYITGGLGSHHQDEAFGDDFELPADRAYAETCAGIASVMLSWRLLLATGDGQYSDLIERTLLNNVLASPRADGRAFYYTNTLHQRTPGGVPDQHQLSHRAESGLRAPWFEVSCCPTNVARTLASVSLYFATASSDGIQLHQYGDCRVSTVLDAGIRHPAGLERVSRQFHGLRAYHRGPRRRGGPQVASARVGARRRRAERAPDHPGSGLRRDPARLQRRRIRGRHVSRRGPGYLPGRAHRRHPWHLRRGARAARARLGVTRPAAGVERQ